VCAVLTATVFCAGFAAHGPVLAHVAVADINHKPGWASSSAYNSTAANGWGRSPCEHQSSRYGCAGWGPFHWKEQIPWCCIWHRRCAAGVERSLAQLVAWTKSWGNTRYDAQIDNGTLAHRFIASLPRHHRRSSFCNIALAESWFTRSDAPSWARCHPA
jgi:hypothetical protein